MIWLMVVISVLGVGASAFYFADQYTPIELAIGSVASLVLSLAFVMPMMLVIDEWAQGVTERVGKWSGILVERELPPGLPNEEGRLVCGECRAPLLKVGTRVYYGCDCIDKEHKYGNS